MKVICQTQHLSIQQKLFFAFIINLMILFDNTTSGTCLICVGHSDGTCYCNRESMSTHCYKISQAFEVLALLPQPQTPHHQQIGTNLPPASSYRREKKDNTAYKLFNVKAEKIYFTLTGKKLDEKYKDFYYRKQYFLVILSQLEREDKREEAQILFEQEMPVFLQKLETKNHDQPVYLNFLRKLVKDHMKAFFEFNSGDIPLSLKTIFDYENMRQKAKYFKALESVQKVRKEIGLSF